MRKGFTLIELLVVIAIIAILAAILFPVFGKAREKARQTHCTNNQKSFATAVQIYTQEHEEMFPKVETFWGDIRVDKAALKCMTIPSLPNGYVYNNSLSGMGIGEIPDANDPAKIANADNLALTADGITKQTGGLANVLYTDKDIDARHNNKAIVSYADGHVEMSTPAEVRGIEQGLMPPGDFDGKLGNSTDFGATNGPVSSWVVTYDPDGAGGVAAVPVTATEISPFPLSNGAKVTYTFKKLGLYSVTGTSTTMASNTSTWNVTVRPPWCNDAATQTGMGYWVSAESITGLADGAAVTAWPAYYPAGVTGTVVGVAGTGPTYKASWKSGKPAVYVGGPGWTTDPKRINTGYSSAVLWDWTVIAVYARDAGAMQWAYFMAKNNWFVGCSNNTWNTKWAENNTGTNLPDNGNPHYMVYEFDGTNSSVNGSTPFTNKVYVDGVLTNTVTGAPWASPGNDGPLVLGGERIPSPAGRSGQRGHIAEVIVYERLLTATELTAVDTYLKTKYGF